MDIVWRQSARNQMALNNDNLRQPAAATVLLDLQKYFDSIDFDLLISRALHMGMPLEIARVAIRAYHWPRIIRLNGAVSRVIIPTRGVVAGDTFCNAMIIVYGHDSYGHIYRTLPTGAFISIYIDDLQLSVTGEYNYVIQVLVALIKRAANCVTLNLKCKINTSKTELITSDKKLADAIVHNASTFFPQHAITTANARNLGADYTAGRKRFHLRTKSVRGNRFKLLRQRMARLVAIKRMAGFKAQKIWHTGLQPMLTFGAEITGFDKQQLWNAESAALRFLPPGARGASRTAKLEFAKGPLDKTATAAFIRLSKEIWLASNNDSNAIPLLTLASMWRFVQAASLDENVTWTSSRGPLHIAGIEIRRLGWEICDLFTVKTSDNLRLKLTVSAPKDIEKHIARQRSRQRMDDLAMKLKQRICESLNPDEGPLSIRLAIKCAASRSTTPLATSLIRAAATHALWTRKRLALVGYVVTARCPLCDNAEDTIFHRLYECEAANEARDKILQKEPHFKAIRDHVIANKAEAPVLLAATALTIQVPKVLGEISNANEDTCLIQSDMQVQRPNIHQFQFDVGTDIYTDGSATNVGCKVFARAGWSAIQIDPHGRLTKAAFGPLDLSTTQDAPAAEFHAATKAIQYTPMNVEVKIFTDCMAVIRNAQGNYNLSIDPKYKGATAAKKIAAQASANNCSPIFYKVKAHRDLNHYAVNSQEWLRVVGNNLADKYANLGREQHIQFDQDALTTYNFRKDIVKLSALLLPKIWPMWPPFPKLSSLPRLPSIERPPKPPRRRHLWLPIDMGMYTCVQCQALSHDEETTLRRAKQKCKPGGLTQILASPNGHSLIALVTDDLKPTLVCILCGAYAVRVPRSLKEQCRGLPSQSGSSIIKKVMEGLHPGTCRPYVHAFRLTRNGALTPVVW